MDGLATGGPDAGIRWRPWQSVRRREDKAGLIAQTNAGSTMLSLSAASPVERNTGLTASASRDSSHDRQPWFARFPRDCAAESAYCKEIGRHKLAPVGNVMGSIVPGRRSALSERSRDRVRSRVFVGARPWFKLYTVRPAASVSFNQ